MSEHTKSIDDSYGAQLDRAIDSYGAQIDRAVDSRDALAAVRAAAKLEVAARMAAMPCAKVKTPAFKAGVAVHEGASVVAETVGRYAKFAGKFAGGVVVGTAGTVAAFAVGTVATGYEAARDFAQGLLHFPNA